MRLFKQRFLSFGYNGITVRNNMNIDIGSKRYQFFCQGRFTDETSLPDNTSANHYFRNTRKPRILGNLKRHIISAYCNDCRAAFFGEMNVCEQAILVFRLHIFGSRSFYIQC